MTCKPNETDPREARAAELAVQILKYARNELLVSFRFMDLALCKLPFQAAPIRRTGVDGETFYFNPWHVFKLYEAGGGEVNHTYLHSILHCIFYHPFVRRDVDPSLWDLSCDIAVEGILMELNRKQLEIPGCAAICKELAWLRNSCGKLTAQRIYRQFRQSGLSQKECARLQRIFSMDDHSVWYPELTQKGASQSGQASGGQSASPGLSPPQTASAQEGASQSGQTSGGQSASPGLSPPQTASAQEGASQSGQTSGGQSASPGLSPPAQEDRSAALAQWQEISQRVKVDLETASKEWGDQSGNLLQNIKEVNRETYDYSDFLRKFSILGEEMQINDDEFDYIFYTYGLALYQNVPLIEPLEYKEVKKIKEFVIAIDTSGSVQGPLVERFLTKTYNILLQQESFFTKINVHIIQCDADIQEDAKITSRQELQDFIQNIQLRGFGGTDFRPVFRYVEQLRRQGEFTNLRGLLYFTDGYGSFPEEKPDYNTAFVFVEEDEEPPEIPVWAIKLVLRKDDLQ